MKTTEQQKSQQWRVCRCHIVFMKLKGYNKQLVIAVQIAKMQKKKKNCIWVVFNAFRFFASFHFWHCLSFFFFRKWRKKLTVSADLLCSCARSILQIKSQSNKMWCCSLLIFLHLMMFMWHINVRNTSVFLLFYDIYKIVILCCYNCMHKFIMLCCHQLSVADVLLYFKCRC